VDVPDTTAKFYNMQDYVTNFIAMYNRNRANRHLLEIEDVLSY